MGKLKKETKKEDSIDSLNENSIEKEMTSPPLNLIVKSHEEGFANIQVDEEWAIQILSELAYIQRKEKKDTKSQSASSSLPVFKEKKAGQPAIFRQYGHLLGILGPCGLPGHIAHFYNLELEVEKHLKSISELGHDRFILAYEYFKQNSQIQAVLVYENIFIALYLESGRLVKIQF